MKLTKIKGGDNMDINIEIIDEIDETEIDEIEIETEIEIHGNE